MIDPAENQNALISQPLEHALLGALLTNPALLESVGEFAPDAYGVEGHAEIHRALAAEPAGGAVTVMKVVAGNDPDLRSYIAGLIGASISLLPSDVAAYARHVADLARRRELVRLADQLRADVHLPDAEMPTARAVLRALDGLDGINAVGPANRAVTTLDAALDDALQAAEDAAHRQGPVGISTGFRGIDEAIGGLEDGTLTILAGRPGMGKSALGWQFALWAAQAGIGVLAVSLEMSAKELGRRALCAAAGIAVLKMKTGRLTVDEASRLVEGRKRLAGLPLTIDDAGGLTAAMIAMRARSAKRRHRLGLILVDHLHIVAPADGDARHGPTHAVGSVSTAMKRLAKEFNVPILLLAQLNRGVEGRDDKRPTLADLRQSGNIEQDADAVMLLYRAEYYLPRAEPEQLATETEAKWRERVRDYHAAQERLAGRAELIVAKVRDGSPGTVPLNFDAKTTSFREAAHD